MAEQMTIEEWMRQNIHRRTLEAELAQLATVRVPAIFGPRSRWPDTPLAAAGRRQMEIARGKDVPSIPYRKPSE